MNPTYKDIGNMDDCLIEEMAELTQIICKAKRFGWFDWHPKHPYKNNIVRAREEIADVEYRLAQIKEYLNVLEEVHGKRLIK